MGKDNKKIKILIVDDDEMMRIYFRDIFWIHGRSDTYEVMMASSVREAEKIITDKETKPDTIFLDILTSVDGEKNDVNEKIKRTLTFVQKVKKDKDLPNLKIIIFSGHDEKSIKDAFCIGSEFCDVGVDGYMVKGELMPKEIISFIDKIHEPNN
jgi:CheY-like chemotaxis protein